MHQLQTVFLLQYFLRSFALKVQCHEIYDPRFFMILTHLVSWHRGVKYVVRCMLLYKQIFKDFFLKFKEILLQKSWYCFFSRFQLNLTHDSYAKHFCVEVQSFADISRLFKKNIYIHVYCIYWLRSVNDTTESDSAVLMQTKQSFFYHTAVSATANLLIFIMTSGSI